MPLDKLRVTWVKSAIGHNQRQKATVRALGLRRLNHVVVHNDTPSIRGMLHAVAHLVTVESVSEEELAKGLAAAKAHSAARAATAAALVTEAPGEPRVRKREKP